MNVAGSLAHGVFREEVNNIALNAYDDDEWIVLENGIDALAYGYEKLVELLKKRIWFLSSLLCAYIATHNENKHRNISILWSTCTQT